MLQGLNNAQIADALGIAEATVKQHAHAVYQAFGVSSRVDLILTANRSRTGTA
jgi:DNA-binding NarL/FixJ family response regulator